MTICIAVRVNECIVFAADSATTLSVGDPEQHLVYRHGHKVFNLRKGLPICAMTYGTGNIGRDSISMLAKEFRAMITEGPSAIDPKTYTIENVAKEFLAFLHAKYTSLTPAPIWSQPVGIIIGGYSGGADAHEVWRFHIEADGSAGGPICEASNGLCGLTWGGDPEAINRLVLGYSRSFEGLLAKELGDPAKAKSVLSNIRMMTERYFVSDAMPVQDAIDLAAYLVDVTKGYVRFAPGPDTVSGDTDIAVVTRFEDFKWVKRKHFFSPDLNPGG